MEMTPFAPSQPRAYTLDELRSANPWPNATQPRAYTLDDLRLSAHANAWPNNMMRMFAGGPIGASMQPAFPMMQQMFAGGPIGASMQPAFPMMPMFVFGGMNNAGAPLFYRVN